MERSGSGGMDFRGLLWSCSDNYALFNASQYAFFGQTVAEEIELGDLGGENDRKSLYGSIDNEYHLFEKDELGSLSDVDDLSTTSAKVFDLQEKVASINRIPKSKPKIEKPVSTGEKAKDSNITSESFAQDDETAMKEPEGHDGLLSNFTDMSISISYRLPSQLIIVDWYHSRREKRAFLYC